MQLIQDGVSSQKVAIGTAPGPITDDKSKTEVPPDSAGTKPPYEVKDYSIWPSILPREWAILPFVDYAGIYLDAIVYGFDATDRHRYLVNVGYNATIEDFDGYFLFEPHAGANAFLEL